MHAVLNLKLLRGPESGKISSKASQPFFDEGKQPKVTSSQVGIVCVCGGGGRGGAEPKCVAPFSFTKVTVTLALWTLLSFGILF